MTKSSVFANITNALYSRRKPSNQSSFRTKNPFLVPLEYIIEDDTEGTQLVYPYIEKKLWYDYVPDILEDLFAATGFNCCIEHHGGPLFFDGMSLNAWMSSWREIDGIPLVVDYGESRFLNYL